MTEERCSKWDKPVIKLHLEVPCRDGDFTSNEGGHQQHGRQLKRRLPGGARNTAYSPVRSALGVRTQGGEREKLKNPLGHGLVQGYGIDEARQLKSKRSNAMKPDYPIGIPAVFGQRMEPPKAPSMHWYCSSVIRFGHSGISRVVIG